MARKLLAIDLDKTLVRTNMSFAFGRYLYRQGELPLWKALFCACMYFLHVAHMVSLQTLHGSIFATIFQGRSKSDFHDLVLQFFHDVVPTLLRGSILQEIEAFRKEGAKLMLLSSSPDFLVEKMAEKLFLDDWHGTRYAVDKSGRFCHVGELMSGQRKATMLKPFSSVMEIIAMTDSMADAPLINQASFVIAVAPDKALYKLAKERGWRIIEE
jgi:phosphoserine phosphatase